MKKILLVLTFFGSINMGQAFAQNDEFLFLSKLRLKSLGIQIIKVKNTNDFFNTGDLNPQFELVDREMPSLTSFFFKDGWLSKMVVDEGRHYVYFSYYDKAYLDNFNTWKNAEPKIANSLSSLIKRSLASKNGPFLKSWEVSDRGMPCSETKYFSKIVSVTVKACNGDEGAFDTYKITYRYDSLGALISAKIDNSEQNSIKIQYIRKQNKLIGFYPARPAITNRIEKGPDSIYNYSKVQDFNKTGFDKFSKRNLSPPVIKKIIEDSYCSVNSNQVLIDGISLKPFLAKINQNEAKYIVIEMADNYFLFYKLID